MNIIEYSNIIRITAIENKHVVVYAKVRKLFELSNHRSYLKIKLKDWTITNCLISIFRIKYSLLRVGRKKFTRQYSNFDYSNTRVFEYSILFEQIFKITTFTYENTHSHPPKIRHSYY